MPKPSLENLHPLPRHPQKVLLKFDLDKKEPTKSHLNKFMLALILLNVEHEYVVCRLFPFTFEGKESTWYFSLAPRSIHNW